MSKLLAAFVAGLLVIAGASTALAVGKKPPPPGGTTATMPTPTPTPAPPTPTPVPAPTPGGSFTATCDFYVAYQRAQVDPIVAPGQPVSAHMHDFYGRQDISDYMFAVAAWPPNEQYASDPGWTPLPSSCRNYGDWASYWYPTPRLGGANIDSGDLQETWRSPDGVSVSPPPFGMAFVAQSEHARFTCGDLDDPTGGAPRACPEGSVTAELTFPDCWDGVAVLHGDYFPAGIKPTHFTYSDAAGCPTNWQRIAQLVTRQHFIDPATGQPLKDPLNPDGSLALSFSSGGWQTYHGDFLNSWNRGLEEFVQRCLNHRAPVLLDANDDGTCNNIR